MTEHSKNQTAAAPTTDAELQDLPAATPAVADQDAVRGGFVMRNNSASPTL